MNPERFDIPVETKPFSMPSNTTFFSTRHAVSYLLVFTVFPMVMVVMVVTMVMMVFVMRLNRENIIYPLNHGPTVLLMTCRVLYYTQHSCKALQM